MYIRVYMYVYTRHCSFKYEIVRFHMVIFRNLKLGGMGKCLGSVNMGEA